MPILLLCSTYAIGELHHLFSSTVVQNWILYHPVPMTVQWNVKYASEEVNRIVEAISFLLMLKMREGAKEIYMLTLIEYLIYRLLDIMAYFLNYKTEQYWYVGLFLGIIMGLVYLNKQKYEGIKSYNGSIDIL